MIEINETEHFIEFTDLEVNPKGSRKLGLLIQQFPEELRLIDYKIRYGEFTCISDENSTINSLINGLEDVPSEIDCYYHVLFLKIKSKKEVKNDRWFVDDDYHIINCSYLSGGE